MTFGPCQHVYYKKVLRLLEIINYHKTYVGNWRLGYVVPCSGSFINNFETVPVNFWNLDQSSS